MLSKVTVILLLATVESRNETSSNKTISFTESSTYNSATVHHEVNYEITQELYETDNDTIQISETEATRHENDKKNQNNDFLNLNIKKRRQTGEDYLTDPHFSDSDDVYIDDKYSADNLYGNVERSTTETDISGHLDEYIHFDNTLRSLNKYITKEEKPGKLILYRGVHGNNNFREPVINDKDLNNLRLGDGNHKKYEAHLRQYDGENNDVQSKKVEYIKNRNEVTLNQADLNYPQIITGKYVDVSLFSNPERFIITDYPTRVTEYQSDLRSEQSSIEVTVTTKPLIFETNVEDIKETPYDVVTRRDTYIDVDVAIDNDKLHDILTDVHSKKAYLEFKENHLDTETDRTTSEQSSSPGMPIRTTAMEHFRFLTTILDENDVTDKHKFEDAVLKRTSRLPEYYLADLGLEDNKNDFKTPVRHNNKQQIQPSDAEMAMTTTDFTSTVLTWTNNPFHNMLQISEDTGHINEDVGNKVNVLINAATEAERENSSDQTAQNINTDHEKSTTDTDEVESDYNYLDSNDETNISNSKKLNTILNDYTKSSTEVSQYKLKLKQVNNTIFPMDVNKITSPTFKELNKNVNNKVDANNEKELAGTIEKVEISTIATKKTDTINESTNTLKVLSLIEATNLEKVIPLNKPKDSIEMLRTYGLDLKTTTKKTNYQVKRLLGSIYNNKRIPKDKNQANQEENRFRILDETKIKDFINEQELAGKELERQIKRIETYESPKKNNETDTKNSIVKKVKSLMNSEIKYQVTTPMITKYNTVTTNYVLTMETNDPINIGGKEVAHRDRKGTVTELKFDNLDDRNHKNDIVEERNTVSGEINRATNDSGTDKDDYSEKYINYNNDRMFETMLSKSVKQINIAENKPITKVNNNPRGTHGYKSLVQIISKVLANATFLDKSYLKNDYDTDPNNVLRIKKANKTGLVDSKATSYIAKENRILEKEHEINTNNVSDEMKSNVTSRGDTNIYSLFKKAFKASPEAVHTGSDDDHTISNDDDYNEIDSNDVDNPDLTKPQTKSLVESILNMILSKNYTDSPKQPRMNKTSKLYKSIVETVLNIVLNKTGTRRKVDNTTSSPIKILNNYLKNNKNKDYNFTKPNETLSELVTFNTANVENEPIKENTNFMYTHFVDQTNMTEKQEDDKKEESTESFIYITFGNLDMNDILAKGTFNDGLIITTSKVEKYTDTDPTTTKIEGTYEVISKVAQKSTKTKFATKTTKIDQEDTNTIVTMTQIPTKENLNSLLSFIKKPALGDITEETTININNDETTLTKLFSNGDVYLNDISYETKSTKAVPINLDVLYKLNIDPEKIQDSNSLNEQSTFTSKNDETQDANNIYVPQVKDTAKSHIVELIKNQHFISNNSKTSDSKVHSTVQTLENLLTNVLVTTELLDFNSKDTTELVSEKVFENVTNEDSYKKTTKTDLNSNDESFIFNDVYLTNSSYKTNSTEASPIDQEEFYEVDIESEAIKDAQSSGNKQPIIISKTISDHKNKDKNKYKAVNVFDNSNQFNNKKEDMKTDELSEDNGPENELGTHKTDSKLPINKASIIDKKYKIQISLKKDQANGTVSIENTDFYSTTRVFETDILNNKNKSFKLKTNNNIFNAEYATVNNTEKHKDKNYNITLESNIYKIKKKSKQTTTSLVSKHDTLKEPEDFTTLEIYDFNENDNSLKVLPLLTHKLTKATPRKPFSTNKKIKVVGSSKAKAKRTTTTKSSPVLNFHRKFDFNKKVENRMKIGKKVDTGKIDITSNKSYVDSNKNYDSKNKSLYATKSQTTPMLIVVSESVTENLNTSLKQVVLETPRTTIESVSSVLTTPIDKVKYKSTTTATHTTTVSERIDTLTTEKTKLIASTLTNNIENYKEEHTTQSPENSISTDQPVFFKDTIIAVPLMKEIVKSNKITTEPDISKAALIINSYIMNKSIETLLAQENLTTFQPNEIENTSWKTEIGVITNKNEVMTTDTKYLNAKDSTLWKTEIDMVTDKNEPLTTYTKSLPNDIVSKSLKKEIDMITNENELLTTDTKSVETGPYKIATAYKDEAEHKTESENILQNVANNIKCNNSQKIHADAEINDLVEALIAKLKSIKTKNVIAQPQNYISTRVQVTSQDVKKTAETHIAELNSVFNQPILNNKETTDDQVQTNVQLVQTTANSLATTENLDVNSIPTELVHKNELKGKFNEDNNGFNQASEAKPTYDKERMETTTILIDTDTTNYLLQTKSIVSTEYLSLNNNFDLQTTPWTLESKTHLEGSLTTDIKIDSDVYSSYLLDETKEENVDSNKNSSHLDPVESWKQKVLEEEENLREEINITDILRFDKSFTAKHTIASTASSTSLYIDLIENSYGTKPNSVSEMVTDELTTNERSTTTGVNDDKTKNNEDKNIILNLNVTLPSLKYINEDWPVKVIVNKTNHETNKNLDENIRVLPIDLGKKDTDEFPSDNEAAINNIARTDKLNNNVSVDFVDIMPTILNSLPIFNVYNKVWDRYTNIMSNVLSLNDNLPISETNKTVSHEENVSYNIPNTDKATDVTYTNKTDSKDNDAELEILFNEFINESLSHIDKVERISSKVEDLKNLTNSIYISKNNITGESSEEIKLTTINILKDENTQLANDISTSSFSYKAGIYFEPATVKDVKDKVDEKLKLATTQNNFKIVVVGSDDTDEDSEFPQGFDGNENVDQREQLIQTSHEMKKSDSNNNKMPDLDFNVLEIAQNTERILDEYTSFKYVKVLTEKPYPKHSYQTDGISFKEDLLKESNYNLDVVPRIQLFKPSTSMNKIAVPTPKTKPEIIKTMDENYRRKFNPAGVEEKVVQKQTTKTKFKTKKPVLAKKATQIMPYWSAVESKEEIYLYMPKLSVTTPLNSVKTVTLMEKHIVKDEQHNLKLNKTMQIDKENEVNNVTNTTLKLKQKPKNKIITSNRNSPQKYKAKQKELKSLDKTEMPIRKPQKTAVLHRNTTNRTTPKAFREHQINMTRKASNTMTKTPTNIKSKNFFRMKEFHPYAEAEIDNQLTLKTVKDNANCGIDNSANKKVMEGIGLIETYPWLGMLLYPRGKEILMTTVVLITVQLVIASAVDINKLPKLDFRRSATVILGHNCTGPRLRVLDYNYHQEFIEGSQSALVHIQIDTERYLRRLRPICAPPKQFRDPDFFSFVMPDDCRSSKIKIFEMEYVSEDTCRRFYRNTGMDMRNLWPKHAACGRAHWGGDCVWRTGTILVLKQANRWHLLGFGVTGPGCESPSRYIDYGMYRDWVTTAVDQLGQPAVTRITANQLILRRSQNKIQRYGPCDPEEMEYQLFSDSTDLQPQESGRIGTVVFNLTMQRDFDYSCVIIQAYNIRGAAYESPRIEIKRYCLGDQQDCFSAIGATQLHYYIIIQFSDAIRYKVNAYGHTANAVPKQVIRLTVPAREYPVIPFKDKISKGVSLGKRKPMQKFMNPYRNERFRVRKSLTDDSRRNFDWIS